MHLVLFLLRQKDFMAKLLENKDSHSSHFPVEPDMDAFMKLIRHLAFQ